MNPLVLLLELLQSVPPAVRKALLWVWILVFLVVESLKKGGVDVGNTDDVVAYIGLYLGVQSAANVPTVTLPPDDYEGGYFRAVERDTPNDQLLYDEDELPLQPSAPDTHS